ncbi:hypothetical protein, partial [Parasutterella excrementihominis]|uniref:hypothetical protein n=1 Tax=Parasutterella excrementihominis TaxID=487175 RepID=UPI0025B1DA36
SGLSIKDKPLGPNRSRGFVLSAYFFCVNMFTLELCLPHLKVQNSARRPYQIRLSQFYLF